MHFTWKTYPPRHLNSPAHALGTHWTTAPKQIKQDERYCLIASFNRDPLFNSPLFFGCFLNQGGDTVEFRNPVRGRVRLILGKLYGVCNVGVDGTSLCRSFLWLDLVVPELGKEDCSSPNEVLGRELRLRVC